MPRKGDGQESGLASCPKRRTALMRWVAERAQHGADWAVKAHAMNPTKIPLSALPRGTTLAGGAPGEGGAEAGGGADSDSFSELSAPAGEAAEPGSLDNQPIAPTAPLDPEDLADPKVLTADPVIFTAAAADGAGPMGVADREQASGTGQAVGEGQGGLGGGGGEAREETAEWAGDAGVIKMETEVAPPLPNGLELVPSLANGMEGGVESETKLLPADSAFICVPCTDTPQRPGKTGTSESPGPVVGETRLDAARMVDVASLLSGRVCVLCGGGGSGAALDECGRMLPVGVDAWVHVNCAVWSSEVQQKSEGVLSSLAVAVQRAQKTICTACGLPGASLQCNAKRCLLPHPAPSRPVWPNHPATSRPVPPHSTPNPWPSP